MLVFASHNLRCQAQSPSISTRWQALLSMRIPYRVISVCRPFVASSQTPRTRLVSYSSGEMCLPNYPWSLERQHVKSCISIRHCSPLRCSHEIGEKSERDWNQLVLPLCEVLTTLYLGDASRTQFGPHAISNWRWLYIG